MPLDRLQEMERAALSCSARFLGLEAEVLMSKKENSALDDLKASLSEENIELKKNKELLVKTCSDLVWKVETLVKNSQDNLGVLEKLCRTIEKDSTTVASLNKACAEKDRMIHTMGKSLKDQRGFIDGLEQVLKIQFAQIHEGYKLAFVAFGAEPLPFPDDNGAKEMFDWMDQEFESFPRLLQELVIMRPPCVCEGVLKLLVGGGCSDFLNLGARSYQFPSASELHAHEISKKNCLKQFWEASECDYAKLVARDRLAKAKEEELREKDEAGGSEQQEV